ncbi:unnamed protein product [Heterobilharzia americana]|nr:unnamed protein product [Heterobilharzia americana]
MKGMKRKLLTSQQLVDEYPNLPSRKNPIQPVIPITKNKNLTSPILHLTVSSLLYQTLDQTSRIGGGVNEHSSTFHTSNKSRNDEKTSSKICLYHLPRIFRRPLLITNFRPLLAPFIPIFIRILVNQIEEECYKTSWDLIFKELNESYDEAKIVLLKIIQHWQNEKQLKYFVNKLKLDVKIMTIRLFLNELDNKLLNFSHSATMNIVQSPLLDLFLRPNKRIREIVQQITLSQSCVQMDTLSFIMIHLLHAWEYASNPIEGKVSLGRIYGNILISFSEKPELRGLEPGEFKTIESVLLEAILELCNFQFWQQMTMLKIRSVFEYISDMEKRFATDFRIHQEESIIQHKLTNNDRKTRLSKQINQEMDTMKSRNGANQKDDNDLEQITIMDMFPLFKVGSNNSLYKSGHSKVTSSLSIQKTKIQ